MTRKSKNAGALQQASITLQEIEVELSGKRRAQLLNGDISQRVSARCASTECRTRATPMGIDRWAGSRAGSRVWAQRPMARNSCPGDIAIRANV
jgi:hypothetical protein